MTFPLFPSLRCRCSLPRPFRDCLQIMRDDWGRVRYCTACELLSYKTKVGKINEKTSKDAKITLFINKRDHSLLFKVRKNTGFLIFNSLKQKKLIFSFFVNRN